MMLLPSVESLLWPSSRRDSCAGKMNVNNILNTNRFPSAAPARIMQYEVPHHHLAVQHHDMSTPQYTHHNLYVPNGRIKSENGSERGVSPHNSDQSSRYPSHAPSLHPGFSQSMNGMQNGMRFPSPIHPTMPLIQHSYHPNGPSDASYSQHNMQSVQQLQDQTQSEGRLSTGSTGLPKAFACSTCGKGFARRSDLARHGKIVADEILPRDTADMVWQSVFTAVSVLTSANTLDVASSSSRDLP